MQKISNDTDSRYMKEAIKQAKKAAAAGEVPLSLIHI